MRSEHCGAWWVLMVGVAACAHAERRFPLREPMTRDPDLDPVVVACHPQADKKDPKHVSCAPAPGYNALIWDGADNILFRPLSDSLRIPTTTEAVNVSSLDEVPDSSWFTNRIGTRPMSARDLELGSCTPDQLLDGPSAKDGSWVIDHGKDEGATDGFRATIPGKGKYLFKADDIDGPEHGSAAQTVGIRIYNAVGYFVPCEQIVYFRPSVFTLKPGLTSKHNFENPAPFGQKELETIFAHSPRRGGFVRMQASAWIPGYNLAGFAYQGTRRDDPSDVVPHEDRRELRAKRLVDAWIDRVDDRKGNTLDLWMAEHGAPDSSPGHVVHYSLDTSEAFGTSYAFAETTRRLGFSYAFDWGDIGTDFATLGARSEVWETAELVPGKESFWYFNVKDFVPDHWKNEYPIAAFSRMTERDGAWMARILARFTPSTVRALAKMADFSKPGETAYLEEVLEGRLGKILERYLTRLSSITEVHVEGGDQLCGVDLAEWRSLRPPTAFRYSALLVGHGWATVERREGATLCARLPHIAPDLGAADEDGSRYVRVRLSDGVAPGPLVAHLYDLGPTRGYRLAGLERPPR